MLLLSYINLLIYKGGGIIMKKAGRDDIVKRLEENLNEEIRKIYS